MATLLEYIVVGSGAGGRPLAARLAEMGDRVLLLEAGGEEEPWNCRVPVFFMASPPRTRRCASTTTSGTPRTTHGSRRGSGVRGRAPSEVFYPRARTLGGCTAHYAMIVVRTHDSDWQAVRDATRDGSWAPGEMNRYFARVERLPSTATARQADTARTAGCPAGFPTPSISSATSSITATPRLPRSPSRSRKKATGAAVHRPPGCAEPPGPHRREVRPERHAGAGTARDRPHSGAHGHEQREWPAGRYARAHPGGRPGHRPAGGPHPQPRDGPRLRRAGPAAGRGRSAYLPGARLYRADRSSERFGTPTGPAQEVRASREVILLLGWGLHHASAPDAAIGRGPR